MSFSIFLLHGYLQLTQQVQIWAAKSLLSTPVPPVSVQNLVCSHVLSDTAIGAQAVTIPPDICSPVCDLHALSPIPHTATKSMF